ncbi:MAG: hypothetical protein JNM76_14575 [Betaproteobacteria bacterium]|nr:hypothetical protein [Betaproteobacteria bacterium]
MTARFSAFNAADLATLSSTVAPYAGRPIDNLKNPRRARTFRFPAAGGQSIKGTWGGQGWLCGCAALKGFNFEPAATIRFRGFPNADWTGTPVMDTTAVAAYNAAALGNGFWWGVSPLGSSIFNGFIGEKFWVRWFTPGLILSFQFDISDPTNSWQYNDISRLWVGDADTMLVNAEFGLKAGLVERTEQEESDGGSLMSDGRLPRRRISGRFPYLVESERQAWAEALGLVGKRKQFCITFAEGEVAALERDYTLIGAKFTDLPDLSADYPEGTTLPFSIVEA